MQQPVHRKRLIMPSQRLTTTMPSESSPPNLTLHRTTMTSSSSSSSGHNGNNTFFLRSRHFCRKFQATSCAFLVFVSLQILWNARTSYIDRINVYPDPKLYAATQNKKNYNMHSAELRERNPTTNQTTPTTIISSTSSSLHPSSHGLRAIVTGLEHSGTTLTGTLLINAPCIMGAFETGYLIASTPKHIEDADPWYRWNSASTNTIDINYRLSKEDMTLMKSSTNFLNMYQVLRQRSYLFNELHEEDYCSTPTEMIDKTPRYVYPRYFEEILRKTPGVPVIVTRKNFDKLSESWTRRETNLTRSFYEQTFDNVYKMKRKYPHRILVIEEEDLMKYPDAIMMDVFHHVGLEWKTEYLQMAGLLKKFRNDTQTMKRIEHWKFSPGKHSPDRTN